MIFSTVAGNLGKDAVLRDAGESTVCSFSIGSSTKVKGEKVTNWVNCSIWGKRGEALAEYLTKGSRVCVSGELTTREYEDKTYLELRVDQLEFMGGKKKDDGGERKSSGKQSKKGSRVSYEPDDDDIPF